MNAAPTAPRARVLTVVAVLLTFASGASDVASFTRLGNVFTSVMTGNITLFGLSLARGSVSLAAHTAVAFAGYVAGVFAGTRITSHHADRRPAGPAGPAGKGPDSDDWPPDTTPALLTELALLAGVLAGWELTGARPAGTAQYVILALAACAMGIQSATVNHIGLGNVSTTFLTGTLTGLVSAIAKRGSEAGARRSAVLGGLVMGALLAGVLDATAAAGVPLLPLLAVAAAVTLGSGWLRPGLLKPHSKAREDAPSSRNPGS